MSDGEDGARGAWLQRWRALGLRERRAVWIAALALGAFVLWSVAIRPAWQVVRGAPAQLQGLDIELQEMQRLATEAKTLRGLPPLAPAQSLEAVKAATARLGEKARLVVQGERAVVTFNGIGPQALREWLQDVRGNARARPVEGTLTRGASGFNGALALALGGGA